MRAHPQAQPFQVYGSHQIDRIPQLAHLSEAERTRIKAMAAIVPFRVNRYVLDELIDWSRVPADPIYQLTFPQEGMIAEEDLRPLIDLVRQGADRRTLAAAARPVQLRMNPHPAGQLSHNVPDEAGEPVPGMQHKYQETVLFFPTQGQTCHSYCTYCFRWAQFTGIEDLKFASREPERLASYVRSHPEVTSVLITGGDPLVMRTSLLRRYIEPLLGIEHLSSVRLGTKSVAYWPHRFVTDADADDLLRLFEDVGAAGKALAVMGHYSHPRELEPRIAEDAVARIRGTGAVVRTQAPLIRHVNDDAATWNRLWRLQVRLGAVPYYMFVERDTGPKGYFEVPLARALDIFTEAYQGISGLGRTVRGPSMSCTPGKVLVDGVAEVMGHRVFVLKMLQARDPAWVNRPFFARFDPQASWIDHLVPAFGEREFFYEPELRQRLSARRPGGSGVVHLTTLEALDAE